jgi:polysaccharide export outer membrane protein
MISHLRFQTTRSVGCLLVAVALLAAPAPPARAQYSGPPSEGIPQAPPPPTLTTDRTLLFPPAQDLVLTPGDLVSIHLFGQSDYTPTVRISVSGSALLPLIGVVDLSGLTITQAEQLIAQKLVAGGFYREPQVTLQLMDGPNAVITVIGEAHGVVPVTGSRRLLDVLSTVGGLPGSASHILTIHRPGVAAPIVVDLGTDPLHSSLADIPVFAGDTIVVARIGVVYMIGSFKTTGTISLTPYSQLTLMQATALSGGPAFEGKFDDLRIIRTVGDRRTVVKVDIKKVLYGKAPDPILQPNDIVFLPSSVIKASISNGSLGTILGIAGLLISIAYR